MLDRMLPPKHDVPVFDEKAPTSYVDGNGFRHEIWVNPSSSPTPFIMQGGFTDPARFGSYDHFPITQPFTPVDLEEYDAD